jgi:hypothetical protein
MPPCMLIIGSFSSSPPPPYQKRGITDLPAAEQLQCPDAVDLTEDKLSPSLPPPSLRTIGLGVNWIPHRAGIEILDRC